MATEILFSTMSVHTEGGSNGKKHPNTYVEIATPLQCEHSHLIALNPFFSIALATAKWVPNPFHDDTIAVASNIPNNVNTPVLFA